MITNGSLYIVGQSIKPSNTMCPNNSCPCHWLQPKMVTTHNQKYFPTNEMIQCVPQEAQFFFPPFDVPKCIPYGPSCSHQVSNENILCCQFVPNSNTLYAICFAQIPPLVNHIDSPKQKTTCLIWDWHKVGKKTIPIN